MNPFSAPVIIGFITDVEREVLWILLEYASKKITVHSKIIELQENTKNRSDKSTMNDSEILQRQMKIYNNVQ